MTGLLKKYSPVITLIQKCIDIFIVFFNLLMIHAVASVDTDVSNDIVALGLVASMLFLYFANKTGIYKSWRTSSLFSEVKLLLLTLVAVGLGLLLIGYLTNVIEKFPKELVLAWGMTTAATLLTFRFILRKTLHQIRSQGFNSRRAAVIGNGLLAQELVKDIASNEQMGLEVVGYYDDRQDIREHSDGVPEIPVLGGFDLAIEKAKKREFDEIYIALPMKAEHKIQEVIKGLSDCALNVHLVPDLLTYHLINSNTSSIGDMPIVSIYKSPLDEENSRIIKALEDILITIIILTIIALPMLIIAIAIKMTSKGPVIFRQRRYGMGGEEITVWKFRSMSVQEDGSDIKQATKNDARITPFGNFLRRTSLDELPQFFNVLQGRMSIVGPRPHAVQHNELYRKVIDQYMLRHLVKPGITGWAQINGWRGETDTEYKMKKRIECDLEYIKNWSLSLDIKIIFLTIFKGFVNRNAY